MITRRVEGFNIWALITTVVLLASLQYFILTQPWGAMGLVIYFLLLFIIFQPSHMVHPNTFVFGYYFLWLVCPATVDYIFFLSNWEFILPWGRLWDWSGLHFYTLLQVQITMTTLIVLFYFACGRRVGFIISENLEDQRPYFAALGMTPILNAFIWLLVLFFVQASGGIMAWVEDYGTTFLTGRAGLGLVNVTIIALGSFTVLLAGLRNFGKRGGIWGIVPYIPLIFAMGFVGGFKSRLMVLGFFFFLPYLLMLRLNAWRLVKYIVGFFIVLYVLTLVRSNGFYSGGARFLELIPTYFNVFPLHDLIVQRENPNFLTTAHFPFVKLGQFLGLAGADMEYDISIMLTKEYFPDQWYLRSATQQWPLETELYLNYFGVIGQSVPLLVYVLWISFIFKISLVKGKWVLYPILAMELFRVISTMRGVLLPWIFPVLIVQYIAILLLGFFKFPSIIKGKKILLKAPK